MTTFKFTEEYIQDKLNGFFAMSTQKYVLENLYVFRWESDKFIETRSGLIYEFEIKVTRSDFKNDFKKEDKHVILEGKKEYIPAYDKVLDRWKMMHDKYYRTENFKKPNYFYYAVPEGMLTKDEVPEYAGLIYVLPEPEDGRWVDKDGRWCGNGFYVVKNAPKLHNTKYTDEELNLPEKFYYNMLSWKDKCREEKARRLLMEDGDHKIPYAELMEKYEKIRGEYDAMKTLVETTEATNRLFSKTMMVDSRIIREYEAKMKEIDPDFDYIEFEDKILEEYD